ncbi:armadillo-type protein [Mycena vulgaris]|nr:armadillo-type protein [Mycena vulgaris]
MPTTPATSDNSARMEKAPGDQSGATEIPQVAKDLWALYLEDANERSKAKAKLWEGNISSLLVFAGLFAGVVSSFVIDSRDSLPQSGPVPVTALAINFLWFLSLTFTLIGALAAVLAQTWLVKFSLAPAKGFKAAMERWIHDEKADKWHLHMVIACITVLIQLSLFLFLAGFALQATVDNHNLGWTVLSLVGATLVWYIWITILPWLSPTSPFRTPFSDLIPGGHNIFISDTPVSWRPATKGHKNLTVDAWKALWSWWKTLIETPSDVHVRLGICSSILRNSSKNGTLHAAVMELTRNELTADHCEWIIQFELPYHLSNRIKELVHSPTSVALAERMNYYLCAIMWMINADIDMDIMKVVEGFSPLLQPGGPLLTLDHFPLKCRALAFGIRVYLLLPNKAKEIQREATNWNMMVDSLDPDSTLTVFGAVTRGLEEGNESLSQDCARMLAVYIGSDGFSNETLTKAQATEGSAKDLRVSKSQKDPTRRIQKFLTQLEQVWKAHMCTRAIQLLQESRSDLKLGGLQALSCLAKNDKFKDAVKNALPNLIHTLKTVDWHTSVACLERLSSLYEHDPFREAINGIYPNIIPLLSNPDERVHDAVFKLLDLVDQEGYINKILNSGELIRDLENDDWHIRVAGLQILTRGIKTNKIQDVRRAVPNVLKCLSFNDPDVRLGAVQAFTELAKEKEFHPIVKKHISDVFRLMLDEFPRVCNTVVVLLSDDSLRDLFRTEIEDNFSTIVTDTLKSDDWSIRRSGLLALCELMKSDEYIGRIKKTLSPDLIKWLKDDDYDVRETALKATSVAAKKVAFTAIVTDALPSIVASFKDRMENVQISALECFFCPCGCSGCPRRSRLQHSWGPPRILGCNQGLGCCARNYLCLGHPLVQKQLEHRDKYCCTEHLVYVGKYII